MKISLRIIEIYLKKISAGKNEKENPLFTNTSKCEN